MIAEMGEDFYIPVKGLNGWLHFDSGYPSLPKRVISEKNLRILIGFLWATTNVTLFWPKMPKRPDRFFILIPRIKRRSNPAGWQERINRQPDMVPIIEVFFSEGVEARLESFTVSIVLRSSNGISPDEGIRIALKAKYNWYHQHYQVVRTQTCTFQQQGENPSVKIVIHYS